MKHAMLSGGEREQVMAEHDRAPRIVIESLGGDV